MSTHRDHNETLVARETFHLLAVLNGSEGCCLRVQGAQVEHVYMARALHCCSSHLLGHKPQHPDQV